MKILHRWLKRKGRAFEKSNKKMRDQSRNIENTKTAGVENLYSLMMERKQDKTHSSRMTWHNVNVSWGKKTAISWFMMRVRKTIQSWMRIQMNEIKMNARPLWPKKKNNKRLENKLKDRYVWIWYDKYIPICYVYGFLLRIDKNITMSRM